MYNIKWLAAAANHHTGVTRMFGADATIKKSKVAKVGDELLIRRLSSVNGCVFVAYEQAEISVALRPGTVLQFADRPFVRRTGGLERLETAYREPLGVLKVQKSKDGLEAVLVVEECDEPIAVNNFASWQKVTVIEIPSLVISIDAVAAVDQQLEQDGLIELT